MHDCLAFLKMISPYLRRYRGLCFLIFLALLLEMAFNAAIPMCFKYIVDNVLLGGQKQILTTLLLGLLVGAVITSAVGLDRDSRYAHLVASILGDIREAMFVHLQKLSQSFYSRAQAGDLLSRFSNDLNIVEIALSDAVSWALLPGLDVLASCSLLFFIDWRLAVISMLVWPVSLVGPKFFAPKVGAGSYELKQIEADTLGLIQENLSAQPVIKAFNLADSTVVRFRKKNDELNRVFARLGFFSSMVERSANIGIIFLQVLVVGIGAVMVSRQMLSIGSLAAFQTIFASLSFSLSYLTQYLPTMVEAAGGMRRVNELLYEVPQIDDDKPDQVLENFNQSLVFRDVSFGYDASQLNLRNLDLEIPRGRHAAFVGPSGSGKSTILNLAMRTYDPQTGSVLVDGKDLRQISLASLRAQTAVVFQESYLFNTSIRENIRIGRTDATQEEVEAAARAAEIHDAIMKLPLGYDTSVGERGKNLSGGQRQRVAIARAILRNPAILILDEATSALDPSTEESINQTLYRLSRNCTTLSVTHRLASVVNADIISYLEDGRIKESGSFDYLMRLNGDFRRLWEKQQGFSLSEDGCASVTADRIMAIPVFSVLDRAVVEACVKMFATENFPPDRIVTAEGDLGENLYVIVRGKVEVLKMGNDGQKTRLAVLTDGDYFGEIALLKAIPRTATVRTMTHCVFITMHRRHFLDLLKNSPELRQKVEQTVKARLNSVDAASFNLSGSNNAVHAVFQPDGTKEAGA